MRALIISALVVLCASDVMTNSVVEIRSYLPSSPDPCFTVVRNGKRVPEIPVELYPLGTSSPYWKSITNSDGTSCAPALPDGKFEIYAHSGRRSAALYIEVGKKNEVGGFEIALLLPDQLSTAAQAPVATRVREFTGVVEDKTGAVMPKVKVEILQKNAAAEIDGNSVAKTESNERGQFSLSLGKGMYVAIFECHGFNAVMFPFEVDEKGWDGLKLTMQVADMNLTRPRISELSANR